MAPRKSVFLIGVVFTVGLASGLALARWLPADNQLQSKSLLDNQRLTVTEITMPPGARRPPYTRPADQLIVFVDEADYEATDAEGKKQVRHRQSGEIVWHNKGEAAPLLVNTGRKAYRNLVIALK